ncbi:hypothetical protein GZ982_02250 [Pseudomonas fluorescens]|nr:hypothetical protein GZ982_02250 [Pseudomonas fluorescens]
MNAKQQIANIDRERVRRERAAAEPLAGNPPEFPGVIVSDADRRVYIEYLRPGAKLPVTLRRWPNEDDTDEVWVYIAREPAVPTDDPVWEEVDTFPAGPIADRPSVFVAGIPTEKLTDYNPAGTPSVWLVKYEAMPPLGNEWESDPETIVIDRRAHYQPNPGGPKNQPPLTTATPTYPPDNIIDNAYLSSLPNGTWELVVGTQGLASGDKCYFYISRNYTELNTDEPINPPPYTLPLTGKFEVDSGTLRGLPAGAVYVYYRLVDAVGNESRLSVPKGLKIMFSPSPVLEAPRVPLASSGTDRLIDLKDCAVPGGVTVEVDRVDNVEDTDEIQVNWNNTVVDTKAFGTATKLVFPVSFDIISDDYYKDGDDTQEDVPVTVKATLLQGATPLSESFVDIFSNIYVPGPTPVDPGPNDGLNEPNVTSTDVDNVIEIEDYGVDQIITIVLWTDPDKPVKDGQQIIAAYEGVRLPDVAFLNAGDTSVTIELPWTVINGAGLGDKSLQYFLSDIGGTNENPSPIQTVTNNALVVNMDPPDITTRYPNLVRCGDLQRNTFNAVFTIPGNTEHLLVGREVTLHAQGYRDAAHTEEAPDTDFSSPTPHTIVDGEPESGFTMTVSPYDPVIRNIPEPPPDPVEPGDYIGYWKVWYTVKINATDHPSAEYDATVRLVNANGEYCEDA